MESLTGYEPLEEFLDKFRNEEAGEDSYNCYCYVKDENGEEIELDFHEELDKAMKAVGIEQYEFESCGGFDSPGYSIDCHCLAYIDLSGHLITIPVAFESY